MSKSKKTTIEVQGAAATVLWEQIHNPDFKGGEFETFKTQAHTASSTAPLWRGPSEESK